MLSWCFSGSPEPDEPAHLTHPESPTRRRPPPHRGPLDIHVAVPEAQRDDHHRPADATTPSRGPHQPGNQSNDRRPSESEKPKEPRSWNGRRPRLLTSAWCSARTITVARSPIVTNCEAQGRRRTFTGTVARWVRLRSRVRGRWVSSRYAGTRAEPPEVRRVRIDDRGSAELWVAAVGKRAGQWRQDPS